MRGCCVTAVLVSTCSTVITSRIELPVTTVSLVQGECLGGGFEAALSSDVIVAEKSARFGFPEILFNLFPGMGAYSFLDRKIGQKGAEAVISSGKIYSADEMLALGIVDAVAEDGAGETEVVDLIKRRTRMRNGLQALAATRRRVHSITFEELLDVVNIWVDAALRINLRDLKLMQRLVSAAEWSERTATGALTLGPIQAKLPLLSGVSSTCVLVNWVPSPSSPAEESSTAYGRGPSVSGSELEYSIQEVSELLSIPIQKLRRWDEQGVLVAVRTSGGHRRYSKELIDRLAASGIGAGSDRASRELATVKRALAEKRRIIQLLLESENRYRDLVETSHDLIWATDAQGRFTYLNTAAHDIFGLAPKDLHRPLLLRLRSGRRPHRQPPLPGHVAQGR